jgi:hypothetical protein
MKRKLLLFLFLNMFIVGSVQIFAQIGLKKVAQSTMNFLLISTSPRACALGDAYYSTGVASEAMFYNPAAMAEITKDFDVTMNVTNWIADIRYLSGGVAWNLGNYGSVGLNIVSVDYGTINGTSLINLSEQSLYPLGYKDNGTLNNVGALAVGVSYAKAINSQFYIGGNIKIASQSLGENQFTNGESKQNDATKLVFDAGVKYYTGFRSFRFGMAIRNFASNIKREEVDEQLPLTFTMGAAIDLLNAISGDPVKDNCLTFGIDFLHQNNYSERINLGIEYKFMDIISLRGGYQTNRDLASWSLGIGINQTIFDKEIRLDYSYSKMDLFDGVNRIGLGLQF